MAIVQISQITNRKGLQVDLPQLAGAELGWSVDTRRLFIGNGTLEEGAPIVGNTEILTEFSDLLSFTTTYTYKGQAAGYTVSGAVPLSLQSWMDQWASVKDFGATGDGVTDDTEAINNALYQLYCVQPNTQVRRALFFPAGVYRTTSEILIPPYATLYGEGPQGSIIERDSLDEYILDTYVARTADSLQQTGVNIGDGGTTPPQYITVSNMGFKCAEYTPGLNSTVDVFLVEDANNCRFQNVSFTGAIDQAIITDDGSSNDIACVRFASTASFMTSQIVFDQCQFFNATWGINTALRDDSQDQDVQGVTVSNSNFNTLYSGVVLGSQYPVTTGATGVRIMGNLFDMIYAEGIFFGAVSLNATGHNIFYNVGNYFGAITAPYTAIIVIESDNNVSVSDLFERPDACSVLTTPGTSYPRILLNETASIATNNGSELSLGTYHRASGVQDTVTDGSSGTLLEINTAVAKTFSINYTIQRNSAYRTGILTVATTPATYTDDYTENTTTGITLSVLQSGTDVTVNYTASVAGAAGLINYSVTNLS